MGQTTDQIRQEIEHQRQELGSDLQQLESKVKTTMDWRTQYEQRPMAGVGIAFGAGLLLSMLMGGDSEQKKQQHRQHRSYYEADYRVRDEMAPTTYVSSAAYGESQRSQPSHQSQQSHQQSQQSHKSQPSPEMKEISQTMENIRGAVMGIAAERLRSFLAETVPGFAEEYEHARKERGAPESTKIHSGQSHSSQSQSHSQTNTNTTPSWSQQSGSSSTSASTPQS